jgi:hypothetical protein
VTKPMMTPEGLAAIEARNAGTTYFQSRRGTFGYTRGTGLSHLVTYYDNNPFKGPRKRPVLLARMAEALAEIGVPQVAGAVWPADPEDEDYGYTATMVFDASAVPMEHRDRVVSDTCKEVLDRFLADMLARA